MPASAAALPRLTALRYVQPLREGGSLPAVVETEEGLYVVKFRGAGQGPRALVAELVVALLARHLGLPVPDPALVEVSHPLGADEPDPEIRDLLAASRGVNTGFRYLDGAFNFQPGAAGHLVEPAFAAEVVWLDAFLTNPDRTARNPNLLIQERRPWLIDHGAALYIHHAWDRVDEARTRSPFPLIRDHVLLLLADDIGAADERLAGRLSRDVFERVLGAVPEALLMDPLTRGTFTSVDEARARYVEYLTERLGPPRAFVTEAVRRREERRNTPPRRLEIRR